LPAWPGDPLSLGEPECSGRPRAPVRCRGDSCGPLAIGYAPWRLACDPRLRARLRGNPQQVEAFVGEVLRLDASRPQIRTHKESHVGGVTIESGARGAGLSDRGGCPTRRVLAMYSGAVLTQLGSAAADLDHTPTRPRAAGPPNWQQPPRSRDGGRRLPSVNVSAKHAEDLLTVPSTEDASESTTFGGLSQTSVAPPSSAPRTAWTYGWSSAE
jgi:hypothetical protein